MTDGLHRVDTICPVCLHTVPADRMVAGDSVVLEGKCPEHGAWRSPVWSGEPGFDRWLSQGSTEPLDHTCTAVLEVTRRCNLACSVCFADSSPSRLLRKDVSPPECDGHAQDKDAGSANSSAIGATEDEVLRRPVRSGGRDFVSQQPPNAGAVKRILLLPRSSCRSPGCTPPRVRSTCSSRAASRPCATICRL